MTYANHTSSLQTIFVLASDFKMTLEFKGHKTKCIGNWPIKLNINLVRLSFFVFELFICIVFPREFGRTKKMSHWGAPLLNIERIEEMGNHGKLKSWKLCCCYCKPLISPHLEMGSWSRNDSMNFGGGSTALTCFLFAFCTMKA